MGLYDHYRKISHIKRTKSKNLNDSHLVLKSSLANALKLSVKSRMKMLLEQRRQAIWTALKFTAGYETSGETMMTQDVFYNEIFTLPAR